MRRAAVAAGIELQDAGAATARLARLAVHAAAEPGSFLFGQFGTIGVHAHPQPRQAAIEIVDAAWQQAGGLRRLAGNAAERKQRGYRTVGGRRTVREERRPEACDGSHLLHRHVHEQAERREIHERRVQILFKVAGRSGRPMRKERRNRGCALSRTGGVKACEIGGVAASQVVQRCVNVQHEFPKLRYPSFVYRHLCSRRLASEKMIRKQPFAEDQRSADRRFASQLSVHPGSVARSRARRDFRPIGCSVVAGAQKTKGSRAAPLAKFVQKQKKTGAPVRIRT